MKKWLYCFISLIIVLSLTACSNTLEDTSGAENIVNSSGADTNENNESKTPNGDNSNVEVKSKTIDVDLTALSSIMIYSEVNNMMVTPDDYIGKIVKMKGPFAVYQDPATNKSYYAVVIEDATACCAQGLEFVWKGDHSYPQDYPEPGTEITVIGEFQTYEENGYQYCYLINADLIS